MTSPTFLFKITGNLPASLLPGGSATVEGTCEMSALNALLFGSELAYAGVSHYEGDVLHVLLGGRRRGEPGPWVSIAPVAVDPELVEGLAEARELLATAERIVDAEGGPDAPAIRHTSVRYYRAAVERIEAELGISRTTPAPAPEAAPAPDAREELSKALAAAAAAIANVADAPRPSVRYALAQIERIEKELGVVRAGAEEDWIARASFAEARADLLTSRHTAFRRFREMVEAPGYTPTLRASGPRAPSGEARPSATLADMYDEAQRLRGDARRAYRGA